MSATDELRAMLNERGVKWSNPVQMEGSEFTRWHDANGTQWTASEVTHADSKLRIGASHVTPAQAVEATLGRDECEVYEDEASCAVFGIEKEYTCCECETSFALWKTDEYDGQLDVRPEFCPRCGRRVKR